MYDACITSFVAQAVRLPKLAAIALSWVVSPVLGALASFLLYGAVRRLVLQSACVWTRMSTCACIQHVAGVPCAAAVG